MKIPTKCKSCSLAFLLPLWPQQIATFSFSQIAATAITGGGFFLACQDFGRMFDNSFPHLYFFLFFKVEISSCKKWRLAQANWFHSLGQDQSTVVQQAERTITMRSLTSCMWAHFLIDSHTLPGQRHNQPTPTSMGKGCITVCVFRCNLPPSLLAKWLGSFTCHCGNTGWNGVVWSWKCNRKAQPRSPCKV